eukprot:1835076-Amphidinium_carterae.1
MGSGSSVTASRSRRTCSKYALMRAKSCAQAHGTKFELSCTAYQDHASVKYMSTTYLRDQGVDEKLLPLLRSTHNPLLLLRDGRGKPARH